MNVNSSPVIACSIRCIFGVLIVKEEPLENGDILLFIDASKEYSCYTEWFSAEQAAGLFEDRL